MEQDVKDYIDSCIKTMSKDLRNYFDSKIADLPDVDTRNLATKKLLSDTVQELKTGFNDEIVKVQTAVTKIATETETKIKELTPPKDKPWYATLLD